MRTATAALLIALLLPAFACKDADDFELSVNVWVSIDPVQCNGNDWDKAGLSVEVYFESLGVSIATVVTVQVDDEVCQACSCPTGFRVYLEIDEANLIFMLSQGFELTSSPTSSAG